MKRKQPIIIDRYGITRFKENKIVSLLLETGPFDMNSLAVRSFSPADRMQFAQLIGYSVKDYCKLSYTSNKSCNKSYDRAAKLLKKEKR